MRSAFLWAVGRLVLLASGIYSFGNFVNVSTNFDPLSGLVSGLIMFVFVVFVVTKNSVREEAMFSLTSPFWPSWTYPQTYWFTTGEGLFFSSAVNLMAHLSDPPAVRLYIAVSLFSAGVLGGSIFAQYRLNKVR